MTCVVPRAPKNTKVILSRFHIHLLHFNISRIQNCLLTALQKITTNRKRLGSSLSEAGCFQGCAKIHTQVLYYR
jgi:hypothetical protein